LGAARRVGKGGRVYAFEPAPESVAILRRHVQLNGFDDRVEIVEAVVSDVDGTTPFYVYGTSMSASLGRSNVEELSPQRFNLPSAKMVATELTVMSLSLDRFAASRKIRPNVMKIDVEGAELLVLTGARNLLLDGEIIVLCEVHPRQMLNCQSSVAELERFIHDIGYSLQRLDEPNDQGIFHTLISRSTYPAGGG
jgi:FkbM family methyltransferase